MKSLLQFQSWLVNLWGHELQVRLYGDGADAQQHFELMTMLAVVTSSSSTLDSRLVLSVRNTHRTTVECRDLINEVIAWSFESMRNLAINK